jgi:hypothetical protein
MQIKLALKNLLPLLTGILMLCTSGSFSNVNALSSIVSDLQAFSLNHDSCNCIAHEQKINDLFTINIKTVPFSRVVGLKQVALFNNNNLMMGLNTSSMTASQKFIVYQNNTYGVTIEYPAGWSPSPGESNDSSVNIVTLSPTNNDYTSATVDLFVDNVNSNKSLNQLVSDIISDDKSNLTNFKLESNLNASLAKLPAYKLMYTYIDRGQNFKELETGTIVGNKIYYIQYYNSPAQFDTNLPVVQKMIDSFKISSK